MIRDLLDIVKHLAQLGVRLTDHQRAYLRWRNSQGGHEYFTEEQENEFYAALERGDTSVLSTELHTRQKRLDNLMNKLLLFICILGVVPGCISTKNHVIPVRDKPVIAVEALTAAERSYVVKDMEVKVNGETQILEGEHYVVSKDFIRKYRRNQDNAIAAATVGLKYKRMFQIAGAYALLLTGAALALIVRMRRR